MIYNRTLPEMLDMVCAYAHQQPIHCSVILTDLNSLINKFDENVRKDKKNSYPLVRRDFTNAKAQAVKENINNFFHKNMKVPELRAQAEELRKIHKLLLPNSTKTHDKPLLQWFYDNWDIITSGQT